jgi:hypothetical protein
MTRSIRLFLVYTPMKKAIKALAVAFAVFTQLGAAQSMAENNSTRNCSELEEAQSFILKLKEAPSTEGARAAIQERVKVGDSIQQHKWLLSLSSRVAVDPRGDRIVFRILPAVLRQTREGSRVVDIHTDFGGKVTMVDATNARE